MDFPSEAGHLHGLSQVLGEVPGLPSVFELAQAVATARRAIEVGRGSFFVILDGKNSEKRSRLRIIPYQTCGMDNFSNLMEYNGKQ